MELVYRGKTKDVYRLQDGTIKLKFKDDVTGEDGTFDPGANKVGLTIEGAGESGLLVTTHFFKRLQEEGIPTHYIKTDMNDVSMYVHDAEMFGNGLEVICRYRAVGSFYRRYAQYCEEGQAFDSFVEVTIKDDERGDPPIAKDALVQLNILSENEYDELMKRTKQIASLVKEELATLNLELYDIKFEFGRHKTTGEMMLIDEISGGNMRVAKRDGAYVDPFALEKAILAK